MKYLHLSILLILSFATGCAQTRFYRNGEKVAVFQGDMRDTDLTIAADGTLRWRAATVNHSAATLAQGEAAKGKIQAAGIAVAASGLTALFK